MEKQPQQSTRVLQYVKHLLLAMEGWDIQARSSLAFRYVCPQYMPLLNEITMNIESHDLQYRAFFKGLAQYAQPVKLNLYISLDHGRWNYMPMLKDIDTCRTMNIQSLTMHAHRFRCSNSQVELIRDFKNLRELRLIADSPEDSSDRTRKSVAAMSEAFHSLDNLEHLTLHFPQEEFIWNLPPKVWYLKTHIGLLKNLPEDRSMFSSVTFLELFLSDPFSHNTDLSDLAFPFTSLKALSLYEGLACCCKEPMPFILRALASNPGLTKLAYESDDLLPIGSSGWENLFG